MLIQCCFKVVCLASLAYGDRKRDLGCVCNLVHLRNAAHFSGHENGYVTNCTCVFMTTDRIKFRKT